MSHSPGQERWRDHVNRTYRYGIPCLPINRSTTKGAIMARRIALPKRSNALTYGDAEVIDVLLSLYAAPDGEAVVIDDAQDTEPKARVRCRNMVKLLDRDMFTVTEGDLPEEIDPDWMSEQFEYDGGEEDHTRANVEDLIALTESRGIEVTGTGNEGKVIKADLIRALAENPMPLTWEVPGVKCRTHTIAEGDGFLPVLSIKPA
jgi:hypothetical protein